MKNLKQKKKLTEIKQERIGRVNKLLATIGNCGRRFFYHKGTYAKFSQDDRGKIWFQDHWSGKKIYTHYHGPWRGFSGGGTLKALVEALREHIITGEPINPYHFGPWHQSLCEGDLWGYGADMEQVRRMAKQLKIIREDDV